MKKNVFNNLSNKRNLVKNSGSYRSKKIKVTPGTVVLEPLTGALGQRVRNAFLDIIVLPFIIARKPKANFNGTKFEIERGRWAWRTERGFEIGLGKQAVTLYDPKDILELGNVLPLAGVKGHTVVDKYEVGAGVINKDIVNYSPGRTFDLVVSISTVEHIGWDEIPQDLAKSGTALHILRNLVSPNGAMLITIPVGVRPELEEEFLKTKVFDNVSLFAKTGRAGTWKKMKVAQRTQFTYGAPFACGNAILVGTVGSVL